MRECVDRHANLLSCVRSHANSSRRHPVSAFPGTVSERLLATEAFRRTCAPRAIRTAAFWLTPAPLPISIDSTLLVHVLPDPVRLGRQATRVAARPLLATALARITNRSGVCLSLFVPRGRGKYSRDLPRSRNRIIIWRLNPWPRRRRPDLPPTSVSHS
jgi:hypothetical protein